MPRCSLHGAGALYLSAEAMFGFLIGNPPLRGVQEEIDLLCATRPLVVVFTDDQHLRLPDALGHTGKGAMCDCRNRVVLTFVRLMTAVTDDQEQTLRVLFVFACAPQTGVLWTRAKGAPHGLA